MRRHTILIASVVGAVALAIVALMLTLHGASTLGWQLATRYTARFSFFVFLSIYLLAPLAKVWRPAFVGAALRDRRGTGVGFAGAHFVHLASLVMFFRMSGMTPSVVTVAAGGLGYVFIAAMALTSNDAAVRALGPNWGRLHRIGLHYVWLVFTLTLLARVVAPAHDPEPGAHSAMAALSLLAMLFRLGVYAWQRFRMREATA